MNSIAHLFREIFGILESWLFVLLFVILTSINSFAQIQPFSGGSGTQGFPYLISSKKDLEELADSVNNISNWSTNKHFKLMNDINDSVRFMISGIINDNAFNGYFDGDGYKITLSIKNISPYYASLFGLIGHSATIKNLSVDGVVVGGDYVGGIAGGVVWFPRNNIPLIQNCTNYANITGADCIAGIIGGNHCKVIGCINYGTITSSRFYPAFAGCVGGIMGACVSPAYISQCINVGEVICSGDYGTGGITGSSQTGCSWDPFYSNVYIEHCVNIGSVKANQNVGGIIGIQSSGTRRNLVIVTNCINYGYVWGNNNIGGITGSASIECSIIDCISTGVIESANGKNGCIVANKNNCIIQNCYWDKQMCPWEND